MEKCLKNVKKIFFSQPQKIARYIMSPLVSAISELQGIFFRETLCCALRNKIV